ncbi:MAG: hypothetical protein Q9M41_00355 [Paracoccaceae bacterium]|nr:hypothetical protein [Paracoccaceae bacterium]
MTKERHVVVTAENTNRGGLCRSLCWLTGITLGGASAWALVSDFGVGRLSSAVVGAVVAVLLSVTLRAILCRGHKDRVAIRREEARRRQLAREVIAGYERHSPIGGVPAPDAAAVNDELDERLKAEADRIKADGTDAPAETAEPEGAEVAENTGEPAPNPAEPSVEAPSVEEKLAEIAEAIKSELGETDADPKEDSAESTPEAPSAPAPSDDTMLLTQPILAGSTDKTAPTAQDALSVEVAPSRPKGLETPREEGADRLVRIDGLSEIHEAELNAAGIFHFDQLAAMNKRELAWLDTSIIKDGSTGAAQWRKQAIALAQKKQK